MRKIVLFIFLLTCCYQFGWSEIRNYTLNQYEITNETGEPKLIPITSAATKEPITHSLIIAGLGTNRVTAQGPGWCLCIETQIFPMDKPNLRAKGDADTAEWYYAVHDQGVIVIELKEKTIKLHNLGLVPYTYVGMLNKKEK